MLLKMFCSFGRAVYGHVITKFSGMGRFTYPWYSSGARKLFLFNYNICHLKSFGLFWVKIDDFTRAKIPRNVTFFKNYLSNSLLTVKSFQSNAQKFPQAIPGLHMAAFDLSFTYVLVSSKSSNQHLLLKCDNILKHFSPVQHCSRFKT